jgi:muramoyltetrapeptide carboxypeptidase
MLTRRTFLTTTALTAGSNLLSRGERERAAPSRASEASATPRERSEHPPCEAQPSATPARLRQGSGEAPLRPARLRPGDTVGLVAPATATFFPVDIDIAEESLVAMGLKVKRGAHLLDRFGFLAGRDKDRAADINGFFNDPSIAGIVALRGGWGCARLLPYLDYAAAAKQPKVVLGYSDITALLNGLHARTGLVTFHGPVGVSRWNAFNADAMKRVIFAGEAVTFENLREFEDGELAQRKHRVRTITAGIARGRMLGGNLTVLTSILGSAYVPDFRGAILFIEDTNEAPYRVDRMMTQLKLAGILGQVRGVVFGECSECDPGEGSYGSLTLEEILIDHLAPLGVPAWHNAMIGHIPEQFTIAVGSEVEIDATRGSIRMLEPAVV